MKYKKIKHKHIGLYIPSLDPIGMFSKGGKITGKTGAYKDPLGNKEWSYDNVNGNWIAYKNGIRYDISQNPMYEYSINELNKAYQTRLESDRNPSNIYPKSYPSNSNLKGPYDSVKDPNIPIDVRQEILNKRNSGYQKDDRNYFIYSKEASKFFILDGDDNVIDAVKAGRGKKKGDDPNTRIMGTNLGTPTTPSGKYIFERIDDSPEAIHEYGTPYYQFDHDSLGTMGVHGIYKPEINIRKKILQNPNVLDKLISNGCINVPQEFLQKHPPKIGNKFIITPEPTLLQSYRQDGTIETPTFKHGGTVPSFAETFKEARAQLGDNKIFTWNGKKYTTSIAKNKKNGNYVNENTFPDMLAKSNNKYTIIDDKINQTKLPPINMNMPKGQVYKGEPGEEFVKMGTNSMGKPIYKQTKQKLATGEAEYVPVETAFMPAAKGLGVAGNFAADLITGSFGIKNPVKKSMYSKAAGVLERDLLHTPKPIIVNGEKVKNSIEWKKAYDAESKLTGVNRPLEKKEINFLNREIKKRGILEIDRRHPLDPRQALFKRGLVPEDYRIGKVIKDFIPNLIKGNARSQYTMGIGRENAFNQYLGIPTKNSIYRIHPNSTGDELLYTIPNSKLGKGFENAWKVDKNTIDELNTYPSYKKNGIKYIDDVDTYSGTGGGVYWKVSPEKRGYKNYTMEDVWDINPFSRLNNMPNFIKNIDTRHIMGGKNFKINLDYKVSPKGNKVIPLVPYKKGGLIINNNTSINNYWKIIE